MVNQHSFKRRRIVCAQLGFQFFNYPARALYGQRKRSVRRELSRLADKRVVAINGIGELFRLFALLIFSVAVHKRSCRIMRVIIFTESEREEPPGGGACAGLQVDTGHLEISQME